MATSTYDVYIVDTPDKKNNEDNPSPDEDKPVDKPPKCRRQWRRSRSCRVKDSNTGTGDNETPDDDEDPEYPIEPTSEQDDREEGEYSPRHANKEDAEDNNYMPESEEEVSLGDEDFIVPKEPLDQERFKRQLIATARSLKKKQQQLKAEQDTLNERWTKVLATEEYGQERPVKSYPKRKLLP